MSISPKPQFVLNNVLIILVLILHRVTTDKFTDPLVKQANRPKDPSKEGESDSVWKSYFPQLLGGGVVIALLVAFVLWWTCTKRGEQRDQMEINYSRAGYKKEFVNAGRASHTVWVPPGQTLEDVQGRRSSSATGQSSHTLPPYKSIGICKPACVCGPSGSEGGRAGRKWTYKEDKESYAPA